jgi:hypothetical protein
MFDTLHVSARIVGGVEHPQTALILVQSGAGIAFVPGAPRSMKMGTIRPRLPYDAATRFALQSADLRCAALSHYASCATIVVLGSVSEVCRDMK